MTISGLRYTASDSVNKTQQQGFSRWFTFLKRMAFKENTQFNYEKISKRHINRYKARDHLWRQTQSTPKPWQWLLFRRMCTARALWRRRGELIANWVYYFVLQYIVDPFIATIWVSTITPVATVLRAHRSVAVFSPPRPPLCLLPSLPSLSRFFWSLPETTILLHHRLGPVSVPLFVVVCRCSGTKVSPPSSRLICLASLPSPPSAH